VHFVLDIRVHARAVLLVDQLSEPVETLLDHLLQFDQRIMESGARRLRSCRAIPYSLRSRLLGAPRWPAASH
jgi:hypothetical protein